MRGAAEVEHARRRRTRPDLFEHDPLGCVALEQRSILPECEQAAADTASAKKPVGIRYVPEVDHAQDRDQGESGATRERRLHGADGHGRQQHEPRQRIPRIREHGERGCHREQGAERGCARFPPRQRDRDCARKEDQPKPEAAIPAFDMARGGERQVPGERQQ